MAFPVGSYLGEGIYVTSAGHKGSFSSFAQVYGDEWTAAYLRGGKLTNYHARFDFADDSFYNVNVTQIDSAGTQTSHLGYGYCMGNTCHLSAFLNHGLLEETVRFLPNEGRIERIGSLLYNDENGDFQTIIWDEKMLRFVTNFNDTSDDDDDGDDEMETSTFSR